MNKKILKAAMAALVLSVSSFSNASIIYQYDDGVSEQGIGPYSGDDIVDFYDVAYYNYFYTTAASEKVTSVDIQFVIDPARPLVPIGTEVTLFVFNDLLNDGDGTTSNDILTSYTTNIQNLCSTGTSCAFDNFDIPDVMVSGGFGVGVLMSLPDSFSAPIPTPNRPAGPVGLDTSSNQGGSIILASKDSPLELSNLGGYEVGAFLAGNLMIRANAVDVPEPSTLAIFALGFMGLASRRFKKQ